MSWPFNCTFNCNLGFPIVEKMDSFSVRTFLSHEGEYEAKFFAATALITGMDGLLNGKLSNLLSLFLVSPIFSCIWVALGFTTG